MCVVEEGTDSDIENIAVIVEKRNIKMKTAYQHESMIKSILNHTGSETNKEENLQR